MSESQLRFTPNLGQNGSECVSDDSTSQKYISVPPPRGGFQAPKILIPATLLGTEGTFPWHGSFDCDFNFIGPLRERMKFDAWFPPQVSKLITQRNNEWKKNLRVCCHYKSSLPTTQMKSCLCGWGVAGLCMTGGKDTGPPLIAL